MQYSQQVTQLQSIGQLSSILPNTTIHQYNPDPYALQWQLGVQQVLTSSLALEVVYVGTRGVNFDFYETRNLPDRTTNIAPRPNYGSFNYFTTGDSNKYHGLQTTLTEQMQHGLLFSASYTWSKNLTFGDADLLQASPALQDNNNPRGDYGPSPFDIRHRFVVHGLWSLPFAQLAHAHATAEKVILDGWQLTGVFTAQSGAPANITNPASSYPADRPDRLNGPLYVSGYHSVQNKHQYLNCSGIAAATSCASTSAGLAPAFLVIPNTVIGGTNTGIQSRPGNLQRYGVRMPGYENVDATLAKTVVFPANVRFRLHLDAFNAFNHTNLNTLNTTINSASFGELTAATARTMQIGAQITF